MGVVVRRVVSGDEILGIEREQRIRLLEKQLLLFIKPAYINKRIQDKGLE